MLGVLAPLGMLAVSGLMLLDLRKDAYEKADQTSRNLLQVIERDISRNFEILDLSLRAIVDNLRAPGVAESTPELRQLILFDRAATAQDMGVMFVLDERGDVIIDEGALPPRKGNYADREYFRAHKAKPDLGLYIGHPLVSRLTGERMLPFSRRIAKPDGSFGGVAYGSLKLSYFSRLFDRLGLGQDGAINLYLRDGTRIMRQPYREEDIGANIANAPTFQRFSSGRNGSFVGASVRDKVERHYAFTQIGDLPLILNVALSTREIEAEWREKAVVIGSILLALCGLTIALSLLFERELRRRSAMEDELARRSVTDALTGVTNRGGFEEAIKGALKDRRRAKNALSLLLIDADHFKRYNDRYGHAIGDEVLKGLARALEMSVHRPNDLVARVGGEEFAILLPDTNQDGALRIAEKVHATLRSLAVAAAGIEAGTITVSIGLAVSSGSDEGGSENLYRRADAALYEAKASGRDQTKCAPPLMVRSDERILRMVRA